MNSKHPMSLSLYGENPLENNNDGCTNEINIGSYA